MIFFLLGQPLARGIMDHNSFQLLSEEYTDEEYLELFGSESLTLTTEYQAIASLQRIAVTKSPIDQRKAQARYERESAAKLTQYSLEPTFTIPDTIRATPIRSIDTSPITPPPLAVETSIPPIPTTSNKKLKKEMYRAKRLEIRHRRRSKHEAISSTTTSEKN